MTCREMISVFLPTAVLMFPACEACFVTHLPLARTVSVAANAPAENLQVRLCRDAEGKECLEPVLKKETETTDAMVEVKIMSEEISPFVCAYPKRILLVTADNCETQAIDVYHDGESSRAVYVELQCGDVYSR
jgi:hypothetical protein